MVFPSLIARTILTIRDQQVQVVAPNEVLGQVDNCLRQTLFAMMVCSMLRNISNQLRNLDINAI